jgi:hypothetical protein
LLNEINREIRKLGMREGRQGETGRDSGQVAVGKGREETRAGRLKTKTATGDLGWFR